jgi:acetoin utilization protein AcuB
VKDPGILRYMTLTTFAIEVDQSIAVARRLMREHEIRHLPVLQNGVAVGVLSERDILLAESLPGIDPLRTLVDRAMTPNPYTVPADALLGQTARQMAEQKIGSAVVVERGKVIGIFTTVDACRALADLLEDAS